MRRSLLITGWSRDLRDCSAISGSSKSPSGARVLAVDLRTREEGLSFGLSEFRHLVLVKRSKKSPETFLVSPRPGCHVIEDVPNHDEKWRDSFQKFFDVERDSGLIGVLRRGRSNCSSFDQSRIRAAFAMPGGTNRPPPAIGSSEDEAEHSQEVVATSSIQAQSLDRLAWQLMRRSHAPGERRSHVSLSPSSKDEVVVATRKRRRSSKAALPGPSCSRRESTVRGLASEGDDPQSAAQDDLISLAGHMRSAGYRLPSHTFPTEKEAYAKVAVASSKTCFLVSFLLEDALRFLFVSFVFFRLWKPSTRDAKKIEALTGDWKRTCQDNATLAAQVIAQKAKIAAFEVERDRDIRRASRVARRDVAGRYREILESLKEKWVNKKKEASAEIQLQEEMEKDCDGLVTLAAVSDWSISGLNLPQVSEDSVDQAGGSSVPEGADSS
ncbi:hypothetical protein F2Q69_00023446 [Brassica cretica]|uniref:Uncharacterized protein n=1 Tax=Brassica cretica TaxID=69181 RepID=A0A8S9QUQ0_BRACR|nr:hypothetical protein F2Q69_00023446 [Brassica cretica]